MEKPAQNIQDSFLNNARKDKIVLTIYLMSGVKLSGRIKSFDKYSLVPNVPTSGYYQDETVDFTTRWFGVPEPGGLALLLIGLPLFAAFGAVRHRALFVIGAIAGGLTLRPSCRRPMQQA